MAPLAAAAVADAAFAYVPRLARAPRSRPSLFVVASPEVAQPAETPAPAAVAAPVAKPLSRAGDLYARYGAIVYRRCLRLLHDREAAQDATQEVFLRLVRDEARLEGRDDIAPWLYRVATNHCLNLRRNARLHAESALDDEGELPTHHTSDRVDAILAQRLMARFDTVTQLIAMSVLVEGQDQEEVAQQLGLSRRTLARKLEKFLERARHHLVVSGDVPESARRSQIA